MRIEDITKYSKEELLNIAENSGIVSFNNAKDPDKPTKQEIADAINAAEAEFDKEFSDAKSKSEVKKKKKTKRQLKEELMALKRVVVTELRQVQQYENDDSNRVEFITWGNAVVGFHTNKVVFGTPWFLPVGCIRNLEGVRYQKIDNKRTQVAQSTAPRPAYKIDYLPMPTKSELETIAKRQQLRAAQGM